MKQPEAEYAEVYSPMKRPRVDRMHNLSSSMERATTSSVSKPCKQPTAEYDEVYSPRKLKRGASIKKLSLKRGHTPSVGEYNTLYSPKKVPVEELYDKPEHTPRKADYYEEPHLLIKYEEKAHDPEHSTSTLELKNNSSEVGVATSEAEQDIHNTSSACNIIIGSGEEYSTLSASVKNREVYSTLNSVASPPHKQEELYSKLSWEADSPEPEQAEQLNPNQSTEEENDVLGSPTPKDENQDCSDDAPQQILGTELLARNSNEETTESVGADCSKETESPLEKSAEKMSNQLAHSHLQHL